MGDQIELYLCFLFFLNKPSPWSSGNPLNANIVNNNFYMSPFISFLKILATKLLFILVTSNVVVCIVGYMNDLIQAINLLKMVDRQ